MYESNWVAINLSLVLYPLSLSCMLMPVIPDMTSTFSFPISFLLVLDIHGGIFQGPHGGRMNIPWNRKMLKNCVIFQGCIKCQSFKKLDKYQFSIKIFLCKSKRFREKSNVNLFLALKGKILPICFLISLRLCGFFKNQESFRNPYLNWLLKIKISLINYENFQKITGFHWFLTQFFINSLASGGSSQ